MKDEESEDYFQNTRNKVDEWRNSMNQGERHD